MDNKPLLPNQRKLLKPIHRLPVGRELTAFSFPPKVDVKRAEEYQKRKVSLISKKQFRNLGKNPAEDFFPSSLFVSKHLRNI